jgi:hypothetical protein
MGLLDDAIRQHLELKRQHGAPEEELQRQEEEALGPARREVAPADASRGDGEVELETPGDEAAAEAASADAHEQETVLHEPEDPVAEADTEPPATAPYDVAADLEPSPGAPYDAADDILAAEPDEEEDESFAPPAGDEDESFAPPAGEDVESFPRPAGEEVESPAPPGADDEDDLFADEDEPVEDEPREGDPEASDADVLEDTPDFLQETPEHDRLWFEQKPPRDFDFD